MAAWPADGELAYFLSRSEYLHSGVLRPIAGARVDLACRSGFSPIARPENGADCMRVAFGSEQPDAQAGVCRFVMKQFCLGAVLCNDEINTPVRIVVTDGCAPLLAVNFDSTGLSGERRKSGLAIAVQEKAATRIITRDIGLQREKVLAEEDVLIPVPIEIGHTNRKRGRHLRFDRQWTRLKVIAAIEKER